MAVVNNHSAKVSQMGSLSQEDVPRLCKEWMKSCKDIMQGALDELPPLHEVNHHIPLIDEKKRYKYHPPRCLLWIIKYPATHMPYPAGCVLCSCFPNFVTRLFPSRRPFVIFHHPSHHLTCHLTHHPPVTRCPLYDSGMSGHVLHPP